MSFNRTSSRVAIGLFAILLASPTFGQGPLGFQIFAPADVSTYGGAIEPNEGYFFQFDGLYWIISTPKVVPVGAPGLTRTVYVGPRDPQDKLVQSNTLDTSDFTGQFSPGNRFEFGRVEDRNGWFVSIFQLRDQSQYVHVPSADVTFFDSGPGGGSPKWLAGPVGAGEVKDLPVTFYDIMTSHKVDTWGVELMFLHRMLTGHCGGTFEWFLGARYLEFNDRFGFRAGDDPGGHVPSFLADSTWDSSAENHIVGPEIGLRWSKKQGRWMLSTEGRFMAGINCQNIHQRIDLGPNLDPGAGTLFYPSILGEQSPTDSAGARVWAPTVELRLEGRYQITRAISFHAGWTGIYMDGIARGASVINYTMPAMGIDMTRNREGVFINGLTLGFDVNR